MASQRVRFAPATYLPIVLLLLFATGAFLFGQNNLWSLKHLWRTFEHPIGQNLFPIVEEETPEASYLSARIWQAEEVLADGDPNRAAQIIAADVQANHTRAVRLQGKIFEAQGNVDNALTTWQQIGDALSLLQAGEKFSAEDRLTNAMRAFQAAYEVDPEEGTFRIANFLRRKLEDTSRAEEILGDSIATYTHSSERVLWLRELGDLYTTQSRWDAAEIAYQAALDIEPRNIALHIRLGRMQYDANGNVAQAMVHYSDAIALDDRRGYGHYEIATMLRREKRHAEAIPWYAAAVERESQNVVYHYVQAVNMRESGNRSKALSLFEQGTELFPEYAANFYQLSVMYQEDGLLPDAKIAIENAIQLSKSSVPNYLISQAEAIDKALLE